MLSGWELRRFYQFLVFMIALNSFATFALAVRFARIEDRLPARLSLALGASGLVIATLPKKRTLPRASSWLR